MIVIRPESPADAAAIHEVNHKAFEGSEAEPNLVDALRQTEDFIPELSLVAEENGKIVGHILFSSIHILSAGDQIAALSLAPMAVLPEQQNRGIGSALVRRGLKECQRLGHRIVLVLGHPGYYPRFGFSAKLAQPLGCPYGEPGDAWMALELVPGVLDGVEGTVVYPPAFEGV
jgi:putative acetyltransferase